MNENTIVLTVQLKDQYANSIGLKIINRLFLLAIFVIVGINVWVIVSTRSLIYTSVDEIPFSEVGLVLGTSNKNKDGGENLFFKGRIATAAQLYKAGKVNKLIVSGDNRSRYYNEPEMMRKALVEKGVPEENILLDKSGIRTIESIRNTRSDFGLQNVTIITQEFHGYRALFISNYYDMNARVMSAERLPLSESGNVRLREFFARVKAVVDLYIFDNK